jgi:uncharacterized protein YxeA
MKKIVSPFIALLISVMVSSQDTIPPFRSDSVSDTIKQTDSLFKKQQDENLQRSPEQNNQNSDAFLKEQKERDKKQKQQIYLRIAMGIFFLILLIAGLLRRRKSRAVHKR